MSGHPLNKILRLLLEFVAIISFGIYGYHLAAAPWRVFLAILFPLAFAAAWGVFAVRGDPSRSGKTVVQTTGWVRLVLELVLFATASWMLIDLGYTLTGWILATVLLIHYAISYDRIRWLLRQK